MRLVAKCILELGRMTPAQGTGVYNSVDLRTPLIDLSRGEDEVGNNGGRISRKFGKSGKQQKTHRGDHRVRHKHLEHGRPTVCDDAEADMCTQIPAHFIYFLFHMSVGIMACKSQTGEIVIIMISKVVSCFFLVPRILLQLRSIWNKVCLMFMAHCYTKDRCGNKIMLQHVSSLGIPTDP